MNKAFDFLKHRATMNGEPVNYLSTIDGDRPSCRPFGDPVLYDGRIYALTLRHKSVSQQLAANHHACIVAYDGQNWLRINCDMIDDSNNLGAKQVILDEFDWAEEAGYTLDNPDFQILYLANASATLANSDGDILWREAF